MSGRTVEDRLREEYFDILPVIRRVLEHLEAEIRHLLLPISLSLENFERVEVTSRIKDRESALASLRRRQEGAIFYPDRIETYTLTNLRDLAGVRVLAFPRSRLAEVDLVLRQAIHFRKWTADPVRDDTGEMLAFKYWGYSPASNKISGEYQIVSVLTGLFWEIEHSAIYKPSPRLKGVARSLGMRKRSQDVLQALRIRRRI